MHAFVIFGIYIPVAYARPALIEISWTRAMEIYQELLRGFLALMGTSSSQKGKELGSLNARDFLVQSERFLFWKKEEKEDNHSFDFLSKGIGKKKCFFNRVMELIRESCLNFTFIFWKFISRAKMWIMRNFYRIDMIEEKELFQGRNRDLLYLSNVCLDVFEYHMHLVDFSIFKISVCKIM